MRAPGKTVADEFYVHLSAIDHIENTDARGKIERAFQSLPGFLEEPPNVAKLNLRSGRVSLLSYPDFFESPFPTLQAAWVFSPGAESRQSFRTYRDSLNPPILHRKELLVASSHPEHGAWAKITSTAESIGLFDDPATIGFRLNPRWPPKFPHLWPPQTPPP